MATLRLKNKPEKAIVVAHGRFQGITGGHAKLIQKVMDTANAMRIEHRIYTSHSHDTKTNPIPYDQKVTFLRSLFPKANIYESPDPNIFGILTSLEQAGYTKVYVVVGEDRLVEFKKTLMKYAAGSKHPKAYKLAIELVSAGKRNPNATGVEGISGTKLRGFVTSGDFDSFLAASPTKNKILARNMFNSIKTNLKEDALNEDLFDPSIFKAVLLGGGPGSGKDTILKKVVAGNGLVELNRDHAFEMMMKKSNLSLSMPDSEEEPRNAIRGRSKNVNIERTRLTIMNRLGVIINGTADDSEKILTIKKRLEALGYDVMMVFVNTSDEVSRNRNRMRGAAGGREVPETVRNEKWRDAQKNVNKFRDIFGSAFVEVDNSTDFNTASPEEKRAVEASLAAASKKVRAFCNAPISRTAQAWVVRRRQKRGITESFTTITKFRKTTTKPNIDEES